MSASKAVVALTLVCAAVGLVACEKKQVDATRIGVFARLPDWRGVWIVEGMEAEISGFPAPESRGQYKLTGGGAPWNEIGRKKYEAMERNQGHRKATGWGFPMMMGGAAPLQFLITPEETLVVNMYSEVRHIYTDGRDHPSVEDRWPTTWGDSVGHWEDDTLVVDTVSVRDPLKYFFVAPPLSEQAHYVERLRMTERDRIESKITIEDPATLRKPWTLKIAYVRAAQLDRLVQDAFDNDRSELEGDKFTILPSKE